MPDLSNLNVDWQDRLDEEAGVLKVSFLNRICGIKL